MDALTLSLIKKYGNKKAVTLPKASGVDDTAAIQAILDDISDSTIVVVPAEEYLVSGLSLSGKNYISFVGLGRGSRIKLLDSSNTNIFTLVNCYRSEFLNIHLDGNMDNQTSGYGLHLTECAFSIIENCYIIECKTGGVYLTEGSGFMADELKIMNNFIFSHGGYGIYLDHTNDHLIVGNHIDYNTDTGIYVNIGHNISITANNLLSNGGYGILMNGCYRNRVSDCHIRNSGKTGLWIQEGKQQGVFNNNIHMNGQAYAGAYDGIYLSNCTYCIVQGNHCSDVDFDPKHQRYGIRTRNNCDGGIITSNIFIPNRTSATFLEHTGTVIVDNNVVA